MQNNSNIFYKTVQRIVVFRTINPLKKKPASEVLSWLRIIKLQTTVNSATVTDIEEVCKLLELQSVKDEKP